MKREQRAKAKRVNAIIRELEVTQKRLREITVEREALQRSFMNLRADYQEAMYELTGEWEAVG